MPIDSGRQSERASRTPETAGFSRSSPNPDLRILTVSGELDISTSPTLQQELNDLLDSGSQRIEVDLSGVVFVDSSALSALVAAHERAKQQSQHLALLNPSAACTKVLGITGLDRVFDVI